MSIADQQPVIYAVWIRGTGWLKKDNRMFSSANQVVAETAARLYGRGAKVWPIDIDNSMELLEGIFLKQEKTRWHF